MDEKYFTVKEIAQRLRYSEETIREEIRTGRLHAIKIRGEYRVSNTDLKDYLKRMGTVQDGDEALVDLGA